MMMLNHQLMLRAMAAKKRLPAAAEAVGRNE
jgi:hypothetical protein